MYEYDDKTPACRIEELLECPYWVIDLLPAQVPAESAGQFFAVEDYLLSRPRSRRLRRRFTEVLVKLNCYHDFLVFRGEDQQGKRNPAPRKLERWVCRNEEGLSVLLETEDSLIAVPTDSTCMTLYHPTPELLELTRALAAASGLFVWQPGSK